MNKKTQKVANQTPDQAAVQSDVAPAPAPAPAPVLAAKSVSVVFGRESDVNGDAAQKLVALPFPLKLRIENLMPRRVTFPEIGGLLLAHVAGREDLRAQVGTFKNVDQLHRFVTDVQAMCEFNGYAHGVVVETV